MGNAEYSFIVIIPRSTLTRSRRTYMCKIGFGIKYPTMVCMASSQTKQNFLWVQTMQINKHFFSNAPTQAESLLNSLEQASKGISLLMNSDKIGFMYNVSSPHYILINKSLKLVNQFDYIGSNNSSTESDVKIRVFKAWSGYPLSKNLNLQ